jgi:hypothetical protein
MNASWRLISLHILLWTALALAAYNTAGAYKFASCWHILLIYIPPLNILFLLFAIYSLAVLLSSVSRPSMRAQPRFLGACHGTILTVGMVGCNIAAVSAAGQVNCL